MDKFDFLEQVCPKGVIPVKTRKSKNRYWNLHIQISLGTNFQLKLAILIFWTKFAQKPCYRSKKEKLYTTIEFYIFKLSSNINEVSLKLFIFLITIRFHKYNKAQKEYNVPKGIKKHQKV